MIEYLAIPYSDKDAEVMAYRAEVSDLIYAELTKEGRVIYPPISCNHIVGLKYDLPKSWDFWDKFDLEFVGQSGKLLVVTLPGWGTSTGVTAEIEKAKSMNIPIEFIDPTPYLSKLDPHYMKRAYLDGTVKPMIERKRGRGRPRKYKPQEIISNEVPVVSVESLKNMRYDDIQDKNKKKDYKKIPKRLLY